MVTYVPDLMNIIKGVTDGVLVTTTYPDTNICPVVILYETDQKEIFKCSVYERASSTITVEIYAKDIATKSRLKNNIDNAMRNLRFELAKTEDIDNTEAKIYVSKLTYECEVIQRGNSVEIYNKKYN